MPVTPVADILLIAAALAGGTSLVLIFVAYIGGRRGSRATYYATRRESSRVAGRRLAVGFAMGGVAIVFGALAVAGPREAAPVPAPTPSVLLPTPRATVTPAPPTPTRQASATTAAAVAPSRTPALTLTPAVTSTRAPGVTATPMITLTPAVTYTPAITLTPPAVITDTLLALRAIAAGVTRDGQPINAGTEFTRGTRSIHVFVDYRAVPAGVTLTHEWFNAGKSQISATVPFTRTGAGMMFVTWSPAGGMATGLYEVHFALNNDRQFVANFLVR